MVMENLRMASIGVEESAGGYESCKKKKRLHFSIAIARSEDGS